MSGSRRHQLSVIFILLLLGAETVWLLANLRVIDLPFLTRSRQQSNQREAGYVVKARQDLKRRSAGSLIWESSRERDTLYYRDSILTLSQSSATLYLNDQTELHLSENTLVSLEEPTDRSSSEIRIRFARGDLRARNPLAATELKEDGWSVTLDKGSDVTIHKDDGQVELEIHDGQVMLNNKEGLEVLGENEIVKISEDAEIRKLKHSLGLRWTNEKPVRQYTLAENSTIPLRWQGQAQEILVQRQGQEEQVLPVGEDLQSMDLALPPGNYRLRLRDGQGVSEVLAIEIWQAPKILLRHPLPRDRLKTHQRHEFIWSQVPEVEEYQLKLFSADGSFEKVFKKKVNFEGVELDQELDLLWEVQGVDRDGYPIPSFYRNEVYFRHNPLEAPKLRSPMLRKPAQEKKRREGAFWWFRALVGEAHAAAKQDAGDYEALFEWEPVIGADQYIIEISEKPDFRETVVMKTVKESQFLWRNVKLAKYYWRVAAGHSKGRMGVFSAPAEVNLADLPVGRESEGVTLKRMAEAPPKRKKIVTEIIPVEPPKPETPPAPTVPPRVLKKRVGLAWAPGYRVANLKGTEESNLRLNGHQLLAGRLEYEWPETEWKYNLLTVAPTIHSWKPTSADEYPFQEKINVMDTWVHWEWGRADRSTRWGLSLHQGFSGAREAWESVEAKPEFLAGFRVSYLRLDDNEMWPVVSGVSLVTSGQVTELAVDIQLKKYISDLRETNRYFFGFEGRAWYQTMKDGGGYAADVILLFGLDLFSPAPRK